MNRQWKVKRHLAVTVLPVFLGFSLASSPPALAQQVNDEREEVTVIAAPIERHEGRTVRGPIQVTELKRQVSYADLDLSSREDVTTLETRIEIISRETCEELSFMVPFETREEVRRCVKQAILGTKEQVQVAMAATG